MSYLALSLENRLLENLHLVLEVEVLLRELGDDLHHALLFGGLPLALFIQKQQLDAVFVNRHICDRVVQMLPQKRIFLLQKPNTRQRSAITALLTE